MLSLNADAIKDYQTCARLYDYRYNEKLYEPINTRELAVDRFEETMKRVVSFFFYKKQGGNIPSYSALLNRWERLWFPKGTKASDIMTEQHSGLYKNSASYTTEAANALLLFYEYFSEDKGEPFLVDEQFVVPFSDDVKIEGSFDLALRYRREKLFVVLKWSARGKKPPISGLTTDFTLLKHAFKYKTSHVNGYRTAYGLYDLTSSKQTIDWIRTSQEDHNALTYWVNSITSDNVFPPRRGLTPYCKVCPFDKSCSQWNGWLKDGTETG